MIVDLHIHYPIHVVPDLERHTTYELLTSPRGRNRLRDRLRALFVGFLGRFLNYRDFFSGPRVTLPLLRTGNVGVALSVLYSPFDELDLEQRFGAPPLPSYLDDLNAQMDAVEADIAQQPDTGAVLVRSAAELDQATGDGRLAIVHCVEGGFHLGATPSAVEAAVHQLAQRGVAYITLAHLVWRSVATNAPAIPFLPDWLYRRLFPQPDIGLTDLGRAAVEAMVREGVLVDVAHMSTRALTDTLTLLDELDRDGRVSVIASHCGYRFGSQEYNLDAPALQRIAARDGVIGIIFAEHQLLDGLKIRRTTSPEQAIDVLCRHIDAIATATGSRRHVAIGSDLDGFIKPTLNGLQSAADLALLKPRLEERYGSADAELMLSGNVLRVLREHWGRGA
jgi:microsomal dipeptidase-like Zn-dependent dipeptidase